LRGSFPGGYQAGGVLFFAHRSDPTTRIAGASYPYERSSALPRGPRPSISTAQRAGVPYRHAAVLGVDGDADSGRAAGLPFVSRSCSTCWMEGGWKEVKASASFRVPPRVETAARGPAWGSKEANLSQETESNPDAEAHASKPQQLRRWPEGGRDADAPSTMPPPPQVP
jgi:hypothetical protein